MCVCLSVWWGPLVTLKPVAQRWVAQQEEEEEGATQASDDGHVPGDTSFHYTPNLLSPNIQFYDPSSQFRPKWGLQIEASILVCGSIKNAL